MKNFTIILASCLLIVFSGNSYAKFVKTSVDTYHDTYKEALKCLKTRDFWCMVDRLKEANYQESQMLYSAKGMDEDQLQCGRQKIRALALKDSSFLEIAIEEMLNKVRDKFYSQEEIVGKGNSCSVTEVMKLKEFRAQIFQDSENDKCMQENSDSVEYGSILEMIDNALKKVDELASKGYKLPDGNKIHLWGS